MKNCFCKFVTFDWRTGAGRWNSPWTNQFSCSSCSCLRYSKGTHSSSERARVFIRSKTTSGVVRRYTTRENKCLLIYVGIKNGANPHTNQIRLDVHIVLNVLVPLLHNIVHCRMQNSTRSHVLHKTVPIHEYPQLNQPLMKHKFQRTLHCRSIVPSASPISPLPSCGFAALLEWHTSGMALPSDLVPCTSDPKYKRDAELNQRKLKTIV